MSLLSRRAVKALYFIGWMLYFSGSIGYVLADGMVLTGLHVPDELYLFLAVIFTIDAAVYFACWYAEAARPLVLDAAAWTEIMNVCASSFLLVGAGMYLYHIPPTAPSMYAQTFLLLTSAVNFMSTTLYVFNALMSNSLLHASRVTMPASARVPFYLDIPWLAESLNTLPSLGYWATSVAALFSHLGIADGRSSASLYVASRGILALSRRVNVVFDCMYVADALLYGADWCLPPPPPPDAAGAADVELLRAAE